MSFAAFTARRTLSDGVGIASVSAGEGPPLVLLHGYPQNRWAWVRVAEAFAEHFQVIAMDLRGYGDSDAPEDPGDGSLYSKRQMARDVLAVLDDYGQQSAMVLGHDRGARVAYRLALDHPDRVARLGIIEIVPTGDFWASWHADLALKGYHWTFLAQPPPLPERMINADPEAYMDWTLRSWTNAKSLEVFPEEALAHYRAQVRDPARVAAMCADYRAGAGIDRALDDADKAAGRMITAPLRFLWAEGGFPAQTGDPAAIWRGWARDVTDASCVSGHFPMDEAPEAVLQCFLPFFTQS